MLTIDGKKVIGIIYPLHNHNFDRLKKKKNPVYVKYLTHVNSRHATKIHEGDFLFFYRSGGDKSIIGFSKIVKISFKTPLDIEQHYLDRIQMEKNEFEKYISNRKSKPLIFLELKEILKFEKPANIDFRMTMVGKYISIDEIRRIGLEKLLEIS
jgi:hypothetical protein